MKEFLSQNGQCEVAVGLFACKRHVCIVCYVVVQDCDDAEAEDLRLYIWSQAVIKDE